LSSKSGLENRKKDFECEAIEEKGALKGRKQKARST
jgi:hypothetical protein